MTLSLSHCTASNTDTVTGGTYSNTLTPDEGYSFSGVVAPLLRGTVYGEEDQGGSGDINDTPVSQILSCLVTMGGENVTVAAFDTSTGEIDIDDVTGDISITVAELQIE